MTTAIMPSTSASRTCDASIVARQLAPSSISMYARDVRAYFAYAGTPIAVLDQ